MDEELQETPVVAVEVDRRPEPCANYLVGGLSVTLVGLGTLVYGLYVYAGLDGMPGHVGLLVLGAIVTVTGVSLLLAGISRAAVALDHLVDARRPTTLFRDDPGLTAER